MEQDETDRQIVWGLSSYPDIVLDHREEEVAHHLRHESDSDLAHPFPDI